MISSLNKIAFSALLFTTFVAILAPRLFAFAPCILGAFFGFIYIFDKQEKKLKSMLSDFSLPLIAISFITATWIAISCAWSIYPEPSSKRAFLIIAITLTSLILIFYSEKIDLQFIKKYSVLIPIITFFAALYVLFEISFNYPIYQLTHTPPFDYLGNSLVIKTVTAITFLALPSIEIIRKKLSGNKRLFVMIIFLSTVLISIFLSGSETAKLAVIIIFLAWLIFPKNLKISWFAFIFITSALILSAPFIAKKVYSSFSNEVYKSEIIGQGGGHGAQRLEIYNFVSEYAMSKPIIGHGIDVARDIKDFKNDGKFQKSNRILHPHNFAIQIWLELGAIGAVLFSTLLSIIIYTISKLKTHRSLYLSTLITALCFYSFSYSLWQSWLLGTIFITLTFITFSKKI